MTTLKEQIDAGELDRYLIGQDRAQESLQLEHSDPIFEMEARALVAAVHDGRLDPAAMFELTEGIVSGPNSGSSPVGTFGTSQTTVVGAEDVGWITGGQGGSAAAGFFGNHGRETMIRYLYFLLGHNPIAKNIIGHYVNLTIGDGWKVTWKNDTKGTFAKRWKALKREVRWGRRLRSFIKHTYLLGECFTLRLPIERPLHLDDGRLAEMPGELEGDRGDLPKQLRYIGPESVAEVITSGDVRNPDAPRDVESVLGYLRSDHHSVLAPADCIHHRWEDVGNLTRGTSVLFPVIRWLRMFDKFAENRHWVNFVRARIPLIRKVRGGAQRTQNESDRVRQLPPPGMLITENAGTSYEFPEHNLGASEARHDGRTLLEVIAGGVQLPVYFIISNPQDQNYAGLMASDSPVVSLFEGLQRDIWEPDIARLVSMLTGAGDDEFEVAAGSVIRRNIKRDSDAWGSVYDRRLVSRRTVQEKMGLDPELEQQRLENERDDIDPADLPPGVGDGKGVVTKKVGRPEGENPGDPGLDGNRRPRPSAAS